MVPWPGYWRASLSFNAGRSRAWFAQKAPIAFIRLFALIEPCRKCAAPAELLVYDAVADVAIWVCSGHAPTFDVCFYDPGTVPALDGIEPS